MSNSSSISTSSNLSPESSSLPSSTCLRNALEYVLTKISHLSVAPPGHSTSSSSSYIRIESELLSRLAKRRLERKEEEYVVLFSEIQARRVDACNQFWDSQQAIKEQQQHGVSSYHFPQVMKSKNQLFEFKKQVILRNIPCIITGFDKTYFRHVNECWRTQSNDDEDDDEIINISWFINNVPDSKVPIKQGANNSNTLDDVNNSDIEEECETDFPECTMQEWITKNHRIDSNLYLKDWHFIKEWENNQTSAATTTRHSATNCFYEVPKHFQRDILNQFLLRFPTSDNGDDYRFVYWGNAGSCTGLHSDVLDSFSWSYNVAGEKLWTFYPPPEKDGSENNIDSLSQAIYAEKNNVVVAQVIQRCGECIFVPSGWRHTVVNTKETISINHNWMTSCALDLMWQFIQMSAKALQNELDAWGITDSNLDFYEKECLLSKSASMNVSTFFFMILVEAVELLEKLLVDDDDDEWEETCFSLCCISQILVMMTNTDAATATNHENNKSMLSYELEKRLSATLCSFTGATSALKLAEQVHKIVDNVFFSTKACKTC